MRISVQSPYAAYLRVYEPLASFPEPERSAWATYVEAYGERDPVLGRIAEQEQALRYVLATPPIAVPARESDQAFVLTVGDQVLVCPWQTRLRSWEALDGLRQELPAAVLDAFLPGVDLERSEADYERWREEHAGALPRILTSTWHVPLRWFVPFDPEERVLRLQGRAGRAVYYRTPVLEAQRRVEEALKLLHRTLEDGPLTLGVEQVSRWLSEFDPESWLELDYGGLVHLMSDEVLEADQSVAEVNAGLAALAEGDPTGAAEAYESLMVRWRGVQLMEHAN